jgi:alpha-1,3-mannosyltransferase
MKILHVVRQFEPAVGGLESYVKNLCLHQQAEGHICEVLTLNRVFHSEHGKLKENETIDGITVRRVPFIGHRRFFIPFISLRYFKQFDVIHVHNTDFFFDYIAFLGQFLKLPLFATTHGGFFHTKDFSLVKKLYFQLITRFSSKNYKLLFAISQNDYNTFKPVARRIVMQHNAIVPLGDFIASGQDFIYIGRLAKHKQVEQVIRTFAVLISQYRISGHLHIVGPSWDVSLNDLAALAEQLQIKSAVKLHGFIAHSEVQAILPGCGYFVSASSFEGFGMSLLEGMSVGLIPFVQPNAAFKELIDMGEIGLCVDYNESEKAAGKIAAAIANITSQDRDLARDFAMRFSWKELTAKTLEAYESALHD